MKFGNLILPLVGFIVLFAIVGCLLGPAISLTQSAGTGWGCLVGLVAGIFYCVFANSSKV